MGVMALAACTPVAPAANETGSPAAIGDPVPALLRAGAGEEDFFNRVIDTFEQQHPEVKINRVFAPRRQRLYYQTRSNDRRW